MGTFALEDDARSAVSVCILGTAVGRALDMLKVCKAKLHRLRSAHSVAGSGYHIWDLRSRFPVGGCRAVDGGWWSGGRLGGVAVRPMPTRRVALKFG